MRMVEIDGSFKNDPALRNQISGIVSPWTFADACAVQLMWNQQRSRIECYFRCEYTDAGVFLPTECLDDPEYLAWLRRNLEDTIGIAERRAAREAAQSAGLTGGCQSNIGP